MHARHWAGGGIFSDGWVPQARVERQIVSRVAWELEMSLGGCVCS